MTQGLFGSVTPTWTGISPAPVFPAFGASFTGVESAPGLVGGYGPAAGPGHFAPSGLSYSSAGLVPAMSGNVATPFIVPGGVPASAIIATMAMKRGQPHGPASDQDIEELLYDAIELFPSAGEVEVRSEGGRLSLTGSVPNKRVKHDIGELAWAIPGINDVQNSLNIQSRRRRGFAREAEAQPVGPSRKQA